MMTTDALAPIELPSRMGPLRTNNPNLKISKKKKKKKSRKVNK